MAMGKDLLPTVAPTSGSTGVSGPLQKQGLNLCLPSTDASMDTGVCAHSSLYRHWSPWARAALVRNNP